MISYNKVESEKKYVIANCKKCGGKGCGSCFGYCAFIDKMAESGIPADYWFRDMKGFYGDKKFKEVVLNYLGNLKEEFRNGYTLCFSGHRGTGKTMASCAILKKALLEGYLVHYTTMVDAVSKLMGPSSHMFRDLVKKIDFVVIDEVDQRFFPTVASQELYGNHFENMLRSRTQNKLPTIMCTNSEDLSKIFGGEFEASFSSLRSQFVKIVRAGGKDARKGEEKL